MCPCDPLLGIVCDYHRKAHGYGQPNLSSLPSTMTEPVSFNDEVPDEIRAPDLADWPLKPKVIEKPAGTWWLCRWCDTEVRLWQWREERPGEPVRLRAACFCPHGCPQGPI